MRKSTPLFLLLFLAFSIAKTFAQDQKGNTWFFGNELGIRFTKPNNEPIVINNQGSPLNSGGSAVVSDPITGKVLFYTDGVTVYDASGQVMANGSGLTAANNINQPVAISPVPGSPGQYYIFSNNSNGAVTVSLVDMSLAGNAGPGEPYLGEVVSSEPTGASSTTSAMTVIGGETNDFLIVQGGSTLNSYKIDSDFLWPIPDQAVSYSPLTAKSYVVNESEDTIAVIPGNPQANIKLYSFNKDFGLFTVEDTIFNSGRAGETIYDGAWSPDGESLYFSRNSASQGQIYVHYDDDVAPQPVLTTPVYQSYDLQMGPDGKMYHLYQEEQNGRYLIGRIENPDDPENLIYTPSIFDEDFGGKNFPQLVRQDFKFTTVQFDVQDTCANNMTKFIPNVAPAFDSLVWDFVDTTFQSTSPMLALEAGTFPVTMTAWLNGIDSAFTRTIQIIENDLEISLPTSDTTVCATAFPDFTLTATAEEEGVEFYWSNNPLEANPEGNFDSTGTYYVVAKSPGGGCTAYASVQIRICQEEKRVGNIWFFGDRAGIDFNPEEPTPIPDSSVMNAPEGTATISDRNGEILFYTDGSTVWNQQNNQMENGDNIGGDPLSTQSALIVPFPGDPTLYYIFTTDGSGVSYSVVDIKEAATLGAVVLKNVPLFNTIVEKVTAVEAGGVTWLMFHEGDEFRFRAYPITPTGIGTQVISEVGSAHNSGEGYMKFSTDGSRVAAAVAGPPPFVELLDFDDSTGVLSNPIKIELEDQPYGIEFSPDNEKLYISTSSEIFQYHINDTLTTAQVIASQKSLDIDGGANLGALQLGPNGQIYVAQVNSDELLVINGPNTLQTDTSQVAISRFSLLSPEEPASLVSSGKGLPNFVQSIMEPESLGGFEFTNQCLGEETQFVATGRCNTDLFQWVIRNPSGNQIHSTQESTTPEFYYEFDIPGVYEVDLLISNPCALPADTTISHDVEIFAPPADPGFPESIGICLGDTTTLTAGSADDRFIYDWVLTPERAGERANNEIQVWEVGTYRVFITDTLTGCSESYDAIVEDAGPDFDLEEDLYYCVGEDGKTFNLGNPGSEYLIEVINMANNAVVRTETGQQFTISTDQDGQFKYRVTVTDTDFDCASIDSVMVTVNEMPQGTASGSVLAACGDTDGTLTLDITSAGDYSFEVFDFNDVSLEYVANVSGSTNGISAATGLGVGGYYIILTNNTSLCDVRIDTDIRSNISQFDITPIPPPQANCNDEASVTVNLVGAAFPIDYILNGTTIEGDPFNLTSLPDAESANNFPINPIPPGSYVLEVTDANDCKATTNIEIQPANKVPIELEGKFVTCNATTSVIVSGNTTGFNFQWENISTADPNEGFTAISTGATVGINAGGTYRVTRIPTDPSICRSDTTFEISIEAAPILDFIFGDDCLGERTVTVNATGSGNYSYLWSDNAGAARTQSVRINTPGTHNYSVKVKDTETGCIAEESVSVTVNPEVRISLSASPVCDNEGMFTLMAETSPPNVRIDWYRAGETVPFNGGNNLNSVQVEDAGSYYATASYSVAGSTSCTDTDDISVERWPVGLSTLPETKVVICPSSADPRRSDVRLNPDSTNAFSRYRWELDDEFLTSEKIIRPLVGGTYRVTMTNPGGCIIEDEVEVVVSCKPILFVPNAIRPSSSIGDNKAFQIFTQDDIAEEGFQVYIYNRWGELIYQSKDPNFQWDGTFNGNPVPLEKYTYTIYFKGEGDPSDEVYQLQGGVTVLR